MSASLQPITNKRPLKVSPFLILISIIVGVGLTLMSFFYQKMGPEIGSFGNMCFDEDPTGACYRELLGGGFPLQYFLDNPCCSVRNDLGFEDDFRVLPFSVDVLFYSFVIYGSRKFFKKVILINEK